MSPHAAELSPGFWVPNVVADTLSKLLPTAFTSCHLIKTWTPLCLALWVLFQVMFFLTLSVYDTCMYDMFVYVSMLWHMCMGQRTTMGVGTCFCCIWDIVSFLVCQCRFQVSWSDGYAETLFSASNWERWAYRSTPPDPALCNHGNLDSGPTLAQQAFDMLCHLSTLGLAFCFQLW